MSICVFEFDADYLCCISFCTAYRLVESPSFVPARNLSCFREVTVIEKRTSCDQTDIKTERYKIQEVASRNVSFERKLKKLEVKVEAKEARIKALETCDSVFHGCMKDVHEFLDQVKASTEQHYAELKKDLADAQKEIRDLRKHLELEMKAHEEETQRLNTLRAREIRNT